MYKIVGWLLTALWIVGVITHVIVTGQDLWQLKLNELGDFLAGACAPLAFLWLVIGYFQQGEELRQNTEALKLQADELKGSVEQQKIIAKANMEEIEHLKEQSEFARLDREASLMPFFSCVIKNASIANGIYSASLSITNHGRTISHVNPAAKLSNSDVVDDLELLALDSMSLWPSESVKKLLLKIPVKEELIDKAVRLKFEYKDMHGKGRTAFMYSSTLETNGSFRVRNFQI